MVRRKQPNSRPERKSFFLKDKNVSKKNHSNTEPRTGTATPAVRDPSSRQDHSATPQTQEELEQEVANLQKELQNVGSVWLAISIIGSLCVFGIPVCFLVLWLYCGLGWLAALGWSASLLVVLVPIVGISNDRQENLTNAAVQKAGDVFAAHFPENSAERADAARVVSSKIEDAAADLESAFMLWKELGRRKIVPDEEYKRVTGLYDDAIRKRNQPCAESAKTPKKVSDSLVICPRCKNVIADRKEIKRRMNATFGNFTICSNSLKCPYCGEDVLFFL